MEPYLTIAQSIDLLRYQLAGTGGYYLYNDGGIYFIGLHRPSHEYELFLLRLGHLHAAISRNSSSAIKLFAQQARQVWLLVPLNKDMNAAWRSIWQRLQTIEPRISPHSTD